MRALLTLLLFLFCARTSIAASFLHRRNEEYQPIITPDFPHFIGIDRLVAWMNNNIDPCQDFYEYSCGGFRSRYKHFGNTDILGLMQRSNTFLIETVLNQTRDDDGVLSMGLTEDETEIYGKLGTYYSSCLDDVEVEKRGFDPMTVLAHDVMRVCRDGSVHHHDVMSVPKILGGLHSFGVFVLFKPVYSKVESSDAGDLRLQLIPSSAYSVSKHIIYTVLMDFVRAGVIGPYNSNDLYDIADIVYNIELDFVTFLDEFNNRYTDHPNHDQFLTVSDFNDMTELDWTEYMTTIGFDGTENLFLWSTTNTWITFIRYVSRIHPTRFMYFCLWRTAVSHYTKLSTQYRDQYITHIEPYIVYPGYQDPFTDTLFRQDCVHETGIHLSYLSSYLFIKYAFNDTQKNAAMDLVDHLFDAFRLNLYDLDWMDTMTREAALKKLKNMVTVVGYPDWVSDPFKVSAYHTSLHFTRTHYFENAVKAQTFGVIMPSIHQIRYPHLDRHGTYMGYPWNINAFHITDHLKIQVNPGILQRPLLSAYNTPEMNFGSLGMVIGHEICHAFDSIGYRVDAYGMKHDWMTKESLTRFEHHAKCFWYEYNKYNMTLTTGDTIKVDGYRTLSENIADNGGLHVSYLAWRNTLDTDDAKESASKPSIYHHNMTPEQVFFIAFGQTWCSVRNDDETRFLMKNDVHAPNRIRVNGVVSNNPDFARVFGCKVDQRESIVKPESKQCRLY